MYHIIYLNENATLRRANHGASDIEWEHGCRTVLISADRETEALKYANQLGFYMLNANDWNEFISSRDDPSVTSNDTYINSRPRPDKWDNSREIY